MRTSQPEPAPIDLALRRAHQSVLIGLAGCALLALSPAAESRATSPPPAYTSAAIGLAIATIVSRRLATSRHLPAKARISLSLAGLALAAGLGLLGAHLAVAGGSRPSGLLFVLAASLFCLRPPPPAEPPERLR